MALVLRFSRALLESERFVRKNHAIYAVIFMAVATLSAALPVAAEPGPIKFEDVTAKIGIRQQLDGWYFAHAGAWGDVNGDGWPDLYLGAFADREVPRGPFGTPESPIPNPLFLNGPEGFTLSGDEAMRFDGQQVARTTGAIFVDLDNDGDLDLFASNHQHGRRIRAFSGVFENSGDGSFRDRTPDRWPWPVDFTPRNVIPVDLNQNGLLDLVLADGRYGARANARTVVLRNRGDFAFEEVADEYGFPNGNTPGVGMASGDVNEDGQLDFFFANANRLFLSQPDRTYEMYNATSFRGARGDDNDAMTCGADFGDLNGDGLLDLVTTVHGQPAQIDIYLNQGTASQPRFVNVTESLGFERLWPKETPADLPLKAAHLRILDMDNDGRNDIVIAVLVQTTDGVQPLVLHNQGVQDGLPRFTSIPFDQLIGYYAPGPMTDYDRDGRIDVALPSWFEQMPTYVLRNVSEAGHWLAVEVAGDGETLNTMGIGATVRIYEAGKIGQTDALLGRTDIVVGVGYSSGSEARAHFGLGERTTCDVEITWAGQRLQRQNVEVDQTIAFGPVSRSDD